MKYLDSITCVRRSRDNNKRFKRANNMDFSEINKVFIHPFVPKERGGSKLSMLVNFHLAPNVYSASTDVRALTHSNGQSDIQAFSASHWIVSRRHG